MINLRSPEHFAVTVTSIRLLGDVRLGLHFIVFETLSKSFLFSLLRPNSHGYRLIHVTTSGNRGTDAFKGIRCS